MENSRCYPMYPTRYGSQLLRSDQDADPCTCHANDYFILRPWSTKYGIRTKYWPDCFSNDSIHRVRYVLTYIFIAYVTERNWVWFQFFYVRRRKKGTFRTVVTTLANQIALWAPPMTSLPQCRDRRRSRCILCRSTGCLHPVLWICHCARVRRQGQWQK